MSRARARYFLLKDRGPVICDRCAQPRARLLGLNAPERVHVVQDRIQTLTDEQLRVEIATLAREIGVWGTVEESAK